MFTDNRQKPAAGPAAEILEVMRRGALHEALRKTSEIFPARRRAVTELVIVKLIDPEPVRPAAVISDPLLLRVAPRNLRTAVESAASVERYRGSVSASLELTRVTRLWGTFGERDRVPEVAEKAATFLEGINPHRNDPLISELISAYFDPRRRAAALRRLAPASESLPPEALIRSDTAGRAAGPAEIIEPPLRTVLRAAIELRRADLELGPAMLTLPRSDHGPSAIEVVSMPELKCYRASNSHGGIKALNIFNLPAEEVGPTFMRGLEFFGGMPLWPKS